MRYRDAARKLAKLGCHEIPRRGGGLSQKMVQSPSAKGRPTAGLGRARSEDGNPALGNQAVGHRLAGVSEVIK